MAAQTESIAWIVSARWACQLPAGLPQRVISSRPPCHPGRIAAARQQGLTISVSATEAVAGRTVVFTLLPDDTALRAAVLAEEGLLSAMIFGDLS